MVASFFFLERCIRTIKPSMLKQKIRVVNSLTVKDFFEKHKDALHLTVVGEEVGFDRQFSEPAPNRPGLALSGFLTYFAPKRIQVIGNSEVSYLIQMEPEVRRQRMHELCDQNFPALVIARNRRVPADVLEVLAERKVPVFKTPLLTMKCLNMMTYNLQKDFASGTSLHGCMLDYRGIGVLIVGKSGVGKSETALGLLERGAALVADDLVRVKQLGKELITECTELSKGFIEMRGIGIINVSNLYGLGAIRPRKRLDLVVELKPASDLNNVDRLGMNRKTVQIIEREVPLIEIPVAPGRDTARLVAVACLDMQLRNLGYDMADEFNKRLLTQMEAQSSQPPVRF